MHVSLHPVWGAVGSRSPNYRRGQRLCTNCRTAFYTNLGEVPILRMHFKVFYEERQEE